MNNTHTHWYIIQIHSMDFAMRHETVLLQKIITPLWVRLITQEIASITTSCVLWISSQLLVCYESHHNFLCVMNLITISCVLLISPREVIIFWNNCIIQNKITIPVCIKRDFFTTKSPWFINFLKWDLALMIKWYTSHNSLLIGVHLTLRFPQRTWFNEKQ